MTSPDWCFWALAITSSVVVSAAIGRLLGMAIARLV